MTDKGKTFNQAIVEKVQKVLDSADYPEEISLHIHAETGCAPSISYHIKELILNEGGFCQNPAERG